MPIMLIDEAEAVDDTEAGTTRGPRPRPTASSRPSPRRRRLWRSTRWGSATRTRHCPSNSRAAHEAAGKVPGSALPDGAAFDHVSDGWAWADPASQATCSQAVGYRLRCPSPSPCSSTTARLRSSTTAPLAGSRCRIRATPRRPSRSHGARSPLAPHHHDLQRRRTRYDSRGVGVRCTSRVPTTSSCHGLTLGALVAPLFVVLFRMGMFARGAHRCSCTHRGNWRVAVIQCRPSVEGERNPAHELARKIGRTLPIVYGAGGLGGVAATGGS